ncbi:MAG: phosphate acetyltransferase [Myxococcales bacterium]|nr:phosphate acetyltransferase [Myxococcales bacterium]
MSHRLLIVPTARGVGVTSVGLGLIRALDRLGLRFAFYKPVSRSLPDRSAALVRLTTTLDPPEPMAAEEAEHLLGEGKRDQLLEHIVQQVAEVGRGADVVVVEGLVPVDEVVYASSLNVAIAQALDAELVFVGAAVGDDPVKIADHIDIASRAFGDMARGPSRCCVINRIPQEDGGKLERGLRSALTREDLHPLGLIPERPLLDAPRLKEVAEHLGARVLHQGDWTKRRVLDVSLCAASVRLACSRMATGVLIITPGDREDVILAAALASLEGAKLAGLLLTCGIEPSREVMKLCRRAVDDGLPIVLVEPDSYPTAAAVHDMSRGVPPDDHERAELIMDTIASHLDEIWLSRLTHQARTPRMTTPAFRHLLVESARAAHRRIVLPEGTEPRTVRAAAIVAERGIAEPVLLGDPAAIQDVARRQGVALGDCVTIIEPDAVRERYVEPMVARRSHKGLTAAAARDQLHDTVVLGTMMLAEGEVHGLVSGAVHTTANTIRPALQLIRPAPGNKLVSSIFFMCLPEQVLVYGDCAVNPNPTAEELAEIALQSATSAHTFGIEPRVAMISYSTGSSGAGDDVSKVARATAIARERRPSLLIDGPLQYDAAAIEDVGRKKAPDSPVAGRATVFIFPDLNTGNTTYKAVQRSTGCVSIGPMLQGLDKPVNDLSRGALVEDIVFTIALTAIQAAARSTPSMAPLSLRPSIPGPRKA